MFTQAAMVVQSGSPAFPSYLGIAYEYANDTTGLGHGQGGKTNRFVLFSPEGQVVWNYLKVCLGPCVVQWVCDVEAVQVADAAWTPANMLTSSTLNACSSSCDCDDHSKHDATNRHTIICLFVSHESTTPTAYKRCWMSKSHQIHRRPTLYRLSRSSHLHQHEHAVHSYALLPACHHCAAA